MARFSLGQLLLFVFACCVYLAALRNLIVSWAYYTEYGNPSRWLTATQIGAWLVLLAVYRSWRLTYVTAFHSAAMVVMVPFFLLLVVVSDNVGVDKDRVEIVVGIVFAISTLSSFPVAVLTICARGVRAGRHSCLYRATPRDNEGSYEES